MAFAGKVSSTVVGFPCCPCFSVAWKGFPFISGLREVVGGKDSSGGDGKDFVIGHLEVCMCKLALCLFHNVYEFWNDIGVNIEAQHARQEADEFTKVKATAVCIKMTNELLGGDICIE